MQTRIFILPVLFIGGWLHFCGAQAKGQGTPGIAPIAPQPALTSPPVGSAPPATLQTPSFGNAGFDPYGGGAAQPPTLYGSPAAPPGTVPGGYGAPPPMQGQAYGAYPQQPPALYPNGMFADPQSGAPYQWAPPMKLFQNARLRYTWVYGDGGSKVSISDIDVNTTLAFPNFLYSGQPLMVTPSFALHLWNGPQPPSRADLPGQAYSAYLDLGWISNPLNPMGLELGGRIGVFTDFSTFNSKSVRPEGLALLTYRFSPSSQLKGGVVYYNRNRVKLLPAGGVLWTPNPQTRFDIFFPQPKLAQFLTTVGTTDIWWYVGGEYGGGNWTIQRTSGESDQVDINDIRVYVGLEWIRDQHLVGLFELGWVTDRELVYRVNPQDNIRLQDTFMLRGELAF